MMEWYQILSYLLTNALRIFLGFYFVAKLIGVPLGKKAVLLSGIGGCFVTILQMTAMPSIGIIAAEIMILMAMIWHYHKEQLRLCLFLAFFYEVGVGLWEFLISACFGVLFHSERFVDPHAPQYLIAVWMVRVFIGGIAILLEVRRQSKPIDATRFVSSIAILGLLIAITLSEQTSLALNEDQIGSWVILSMVLLLAIMFYRVIKQREMESEIARLKQEQSEILERDYQTLRRTYADNAKLYHDLHNHIEAIYQCLTGGDIEEAIRYCEDLRTPVRESSQTVWTDDKAIDYLISSKMALAEKEKIKTKVNIEYPHNTNIRSVDLTTILGNLLDNALEAVENAPDHLRFLNLTIRRINAMLIIKVENGCGKAPILENGNLLTSKADKAFHGWGLKSVQTATDRYEGTINTEYKDGVFQSVVTLSFHPVKTE